MTRRRIHTRKNYKRGKNKRKIDSRNRSKMKRKTNRRKTYKMKRKTNRKKYNKSLGKVGGADLDQISRSREDELGAEPGDEGGVLNIEQLMDRLDLTDDEKARILEGDQKFEEASAESEQTRVISHKDENEDISMMRDQSLHYLEHILSVEENSKTLREMLDVYIKELENFCALSEDMKNSVSKSKAKYLIMTK